MHRNREDAVSLAVLIDYYWKPDPVGWNCCQCGGYLQCFDCTHVVGDIF